ncbi:MAG: SRPBCC family protein [Planctomycetota bacterium]
MWKRVGVAVLVVVVLFLVVGFLLPGEFTVEQSRVVKADAEKIHALVGDLRHWEEWMPWYEMDPTIVTTFGEKTTGVGAKQTWTGKDGDGEILITRSDPTSGIEYDMVMIEGGRRMPSQGGVRYAQEGDGIKVTWSMSGEIDTPVIGGYLALAMDRFLIGPSFQEGLEKLGKLASGG